jgi:hypothetical protein
LEELRLQRDILKLKAFERDPEYWKTHDMEALKARRKEVDIEALKVERELFEAKTRAGDNGTA